MARANAANTAGWLDYSAALMRLPPTTVLVR
jgi:hypothetical protein